jgi:ribonuclease HII
MSKLLCLAKIHDEINHFEIGIDEAGRGPLFGRLYVAAAVLPKDNTFQHEKMRDSKTIKSRKKIQELANYIKENAIAWHIHYVDASVIDTINIRQAVLMAMHECAKQVIAQLQSITTNVSESVQALEQGSETIQTYEREYMLLVDGNDFTPHMIYDETLQSMKEIMHETIEGGDNKYSAIAAASILAKVARDQYIEELCEKYPTLIEYYSIDTNKGYGARKHLDGIKQHGITEWHRKSFAPCKNQGKTKSENFTFTHVEIVESEDE